jgi:hypothetical protein
VLLRIAVRTGIQLIEEVLENSWRRCSTLDNQADRLNHTTATDWRSDDRLA